MLLRLDVPDGVHRVRVIADPVMTRWDEADVTVSRRRGRGAARHIVQVTVHRHGRIDAVPHAALLSGWGDWDGAVATTVAHDTHNLVVFGRDPHEMALAANTVIASGGGVAVVRGTEVLAHIALPIAGILSPLPAAEVAAAQRTVQDAAVGHRPVRRLAHAAAVPGDALVARVPPRPARHRRRPHRRHHRRSRRHRTHLLTRTAASSRGHDARWCLGDEGGGGAPATVVRAGGALPRARHDRDRQHDPHGRDPEPRRELHADETDLQWIATSYGLVLAGLLLPLAVLGDRYGRKGLLLIGLAVFGAASGAAAFATSPLMLTITRGAMGVGGACTMPATLSILGNVFDHDERGRAIAIWSGIAGVASAAGPIAGGLLLARFWWGSIFLVNVPLAVIAIVAAILLVPTSRDPAARPLDRGSALRWWAALTAALVAIIEGPQQGWTSPVVLGAAAAAIVLLVAFVHRERVSDRPMIPRATVRDPRLRWGAVTMAALFFAAFGVQFVLTQWLQGPRHKSAMGAAVYFLPNAIAGIVASLRNPRWVARFGQGAVARAVSGDGRWRRADRDRCRGLVGGHVCSSRRCSWASASARRRRRERSSSCRRRRPTTRGAAGA